MSKHNKPFAIADVTSGVLNALAKSIMRQTGQDDAGKAIRLVTSGEWLLKRPKREWRKENGVIRLEVTSDGTTGPAWMKRLEKQGVGLHGNVVDVLSSPDFNATRDVTYHVAILKSVIKLGQFVHVRTDAEARKLKASEIEVACLIREKFSDWEIRAMGILWIHVMHKPVLSNGVPIILSVYADSDEYENYIWVQPEQGDSNLVSEEIGFAYILGKS